MKVILYHSILLIILMIGNRRSPVSLSAPGASTNDNMRWYVKQSANGNKDGTSWQHAFTDLQAAINAAATGDTLWVAGGTYVPATDISGEPDPEDYRTRVFYLNKDLHIYGGFKGEETSLTARQPKSYPAVLEHPGQGFLKDNPFHLLIVDGVGASSRLDGLLVKENAPFLAAGARATVKLINSTVVFANCEFIHENFVNSDTTIAISGNSDPLFVNCHFSFNAKRGIVSESNLRLVNGIFDSGATTESGLITLVGGEQAVVLNTTFYNNNIAANSGIVENRGTDTACIANCIFWGNLESVAILDAGPASFTKVTHCVVENGCDNLLADSCDPSSIIDQDPAFTDPDDGDYHFPFTSPLWNTGSNAVIVPFQSYGDYQGRKRIENGWVDIGPLELQCGLFFVSPDGDDQHTGTSWAEAFATLDKAVSMPLCQPEGNIIWMATGTYAPTTDAKGLNDPDDECLKTYYVDKPLSIYGGFAGGEQFLHQRQGLGPTVLSGDIQQDQDHGNNVYHIFDLSGLPENEELELDRIDIRGGNARNGTGGGIYNLNGRLRLIDCTFEENTARRGGALYNEEGRIVLDHCLFQFNKADEGGAIFNPDIPFAFTDVNYFTTTKTTFRENQAVAQGGAIAVGAAVRMEFKASTFQSNTAGTTGGAIHLTGDAVLHINNSVFSGNHSQGNGGAINSASDGQMTKIAITASEFRHNGITRGNGGAVVIRSDTAVISSNCIFANNQIAEIGNGAAIYTDLSNRLTIDSTRFEENSALQGKGGGVYVVTSTSPRVTSSVFNMNSAQDGGGLYGGGNTNIVLEQCRFENNKTSSKGGGLMLLNNENVLIERSFFSRDTADAEGGAIFCRENDKLVVVSSLITACLAADGPGLFNGPGDGFGEMINCTISGNQSIGTVVRSEGAFNISNTIVWGNSGAQQLRDNIQATHCIIEDGFPGNSILTADPLFDTLAGDFSLLPCSQAIDAGDNFSTIRVQNQLDFQNSTRIWAGGVVDLGAVEFRATIAESANIIFINSGSGNDHQRGKSWACAFSSLQNGIATAKAGDTLVITADVYWPSEKQTQERGSETFLIDKDLVLVGGLTSGTDFPGNLPPDRPPTILSGALTDEAGNYQAQHIMVMEGTTSETVIDGIQFQDGRAESEDEGGGGLLLKESSPVLRNCRFENNEATHYGGAVFSRGGSITSLEGCHFLQNSSEVLGGAIYADQEMELSNCRFEGNTSYSLGGAIYSNREMTVVNSLFTENAAEFGGAFFANTAFSPCHIVNSTFSANRVGGSNGIIQAAEDAVLFITNSIIWGNNGTSVRYTGSSVFVSTSLVENGCNDQGILNCRDTTTNTTTNLDANPEFRSPPAGDYTLNACSPGVDIGNNLAVQSIEKDLAGANRIVSGIVDLGAYEYTGEDCLVNTTSQVAVDKTPGLFIFPNPAGDRTHLTIFNAADSDMKLTLLNFSGQVIQTLDLEKGIPEVSLDLHLLSSGVYVLQLQGQSFLITEKLIVNQ